MRLALANIYTRGAVPPPSTALQSQQSLNGRRNTNSSITKNGTQILNKKCSNSGREFVVLNVDDKEIEKQNDDLLKEADGGIQKRDSEKDYAEFNFETPSDIENNYTLGTALAGAESPLKSFASSKKSSINNSGKDSPKIITPPPNLQEKQEPKI